MTSPSRHANASHYKRMLEKGLTSRGVVFAVMRKRLKRDLHFGTEPFSANWPHSDKLKPKTKVYSRREYGDFGGYTDTWFIFDNNTVYFGMRSSDPEWDAYSYSYDQGLYEPPAAIELDEALDKIFDEMQPNPPPSTEPASQENPPV